MQESEATFETVPASPAYRIDLGRRQLYAFAMRYHCEIYKKPSGRDLLAKPRATLDTTRLREMADLANRLGFESSEIAALKKFPKSADPTVERGNEKPALVTDGPGEIRKDRCGMPRAQSYEEDRKFLFINHLHDERNEQSEAITSYFRLRSTYLKFFGIPDDSNPELSSAVFRQTRSVSLPREDPTQGLEHMELDGEQTEDTTMQDREGEEEQHRPSFHAEGALAPQTAMQRQDLLSNTDVIEREEYGRQQYRQTGDANILAEEEQRLEQKRQKLLSDASTLEKQEQEQELQRQQLVRDASAITEQEQKQGQRQEQLLSNTYILDKQEHEQEQLRQAFVKSAKAFEEDQMKAQQQRKLLCDVNILENQEQEQEVHRQRLASHAIALKEQQQEQERRRQKLTSYAIALKEYEREQIRTHQELSEDVSALREQEKIERNKFNLPQREKRS